MILIIEYLCDRCGARLSNVEIQYKIMALRS